MNAHVLLRWLARAQWRSQPGRTVASVLAVAIGVALALAIQLVNASALGCVPPGDQHRERQGRSAGGRRERRDR